MAIITIRNVDTEKVSKGKNFYSVATVSYTDEKGEAREKKVMSFSNPSVFETLTKAIAGNLYDVTVTKQGDYYNWTAIKEVAKASAAAPAASGGRITGSNYETADERKIKQMYIIKQSSIANAIDYFKAQGDGKFGVGDVLEVAQQFVDYVYGNEENMEAMGGAHSSVSEE